MSRFAREKIQPLVRDMDNASEMDKSVINALFEQGVSHSATRRCMDEASSYTVHYSQQQRCLADELITTLSDIYTLPTTVWQHIQCTTMAEGHI